MITSVKNSQIKAVRALQSKGKARRAAGAFVIEGVRLAEEALAAGWLPREGYYTEALSERGAALVAALQKQGVSLEAVAPQVMQAASDTQTPQGILLVLPLKQLPLPETLEFVLVIDEVRDPGNLGTLLRSAAAAGVQAVLLTEGSVDPFSPKVVRAAMGAHFRLPVETLPPQTILDRCRQHGLAVWLAAAREGIRCHEANLTPPLALVIGGEARGAGEIWQSPAVKQLHIPMPGEVESLNAAVAGSVLLFEIVRQRRQNLI